MLWKAATCTTYNLFIYFWNETTYNLLSICLYVFWIHSIHRTIVGFLSLIPYPIGFLILDTRKHFFSKAFTQGYKNFDWHRSGAASCFSRQYSWFFYNKEVARENRFVTRTSSLNKDFGLKWNFIVVYTVNVFIGHKNFVASGRRLLWHCQTQCELSYWGNYQLDI